MPSGPRASTGGAGREGGPAARFPYHRNWSRDRSAGRSLGCSTAGPFSLPTAPGQGQTPRTARHCLYNSPVATTRLQTGAAAGFRKRPVPLHEPSRIFRSRRRTGDGKRRRKRGGRPQAGAPLGGTTMGRGPGSEMQPRYLPERNLKGWKCRHPGH